MADEENKQETTEEEPQAEAEETPAEEALAEDAATEAEEPEAQPAEDPAEPEASAEDSAGGDSDSGDDSGEAAPAAADGSNSEPEATAEPQEVLGPKAIRRQKRSKHSGEAKPPRTPEERQAERDQRRRDAKERRRRYRASRRARRGEPRTGTQPAEREKPPAVKVRQGTVVSSKADKTITVELEIVRRHTRYEKVVRRSHTVHAHDERNEASEGDTVRIVESRPLSRSKRWRLEEIVQRAPARTRAIEPAEEPELVEVGAVPSPIDLAEAASPTDPAAPGEEAAGNGGGEE